MIYAFWACTVLSIIFYGLVPIPQEKDRGRIARGELTTYEAITNGCCGLFGLASCGILFYAISKIIFKLAFGD